MIGGFDVRIPTVLSRQAVELSVRAIQRHWPGASFENASTGDRYDHVEQIPFDRLDEIFVYRDSHCREAWDAKGATHELTNTMIHILLDPGLMTLVFDDMNDWAKELVAAIRADLEDAPLIQATEIHSAT